MSDDNPEQIGAVLARMLAPAQPEIAAPKLPAALLKPGIHFDVTEEHYHSDPCEEPSLSVSIAQALVLESPAHAYLRHPRLGGQPFTPSADMDRGTLIHALLLGKGRQVAIVECEDWKKKANKELRDEHRAAGRLAVTRTLYDDSVVAAQHLKRKLEARGYVFDGDSEVSLVWDEETENGDTVHCRARLDHLKGNEVWDLKITGDANPATLTRGHLTRMGYDIQSVVYPRALGELDARMRGRVTMSLLFCEPEPPYCVTVVRCGGSLRELGERKWNRAKTMWARCLREKTWPDYTDDVVIAQAKPWDLEAESVLSEAG